MLKRNDETMFQLKMMALWLQT